jgi:hypothetical protein
MNITISKHGDFLTGCLTAMIEFQSAPSTRKDGSNLLNIFHNMFLCSTIRKLLKYFLEKYKTKKITSQYDLL